MRAIQVPRPGSWNRLRLVELDEPSTPDDQVKVAVAAAGVNFADVVVRMGLYQSARDYVGWPIVPGFEFAGTVEEVGARVTGFAPGDRVFGVTRFGGYASRVVVPGAQLRHLPPTWNMAQGATFSAVFLTAWYALRELCRLRPGTRVLVHSAAGGVGSGAVQIARIFQAEVLGVVRGEHKVRLVRELGAQHVVDKSNESLWPAVERLVPDGFDVALDANGVETLLESYRHLRPGGRLIVYGFHTMLRRGRGRPDYLKLAYDYWRTPRFDPIRMTGSNKSVLAFNLSYLFDRTELLAEAMKELLTWSTEGRLRPLPVQEYPFEQVADAHRALESGKTVGKLALML